MNKKTTGGLISRFAGVAIGAAVFAGPAYIIQDNIQPELDFECVQERTGFRNFSSDACGDAALFKTATDLSMYFTGLMGGLYGWRRGRKFHEGLTADQKAEAPATPQNG